VLFTKGDANAAVKVEEVKKEVKVEVK
jgi:hypothetical protein